MKKIAAVLILIVIVLVGYSQYKKWQCNNPKTNFLYQIPANIDANYHTPKDLANYYQTSASLESFAWNSWKKFGCDVINNNKNCVECEIKVSIYNKKLKKLKAMESLLIQSTELKKEGLTDADIKQIQQKALGKDSYKRQIAGESKEAVYKSLKDKSLRLGSKRPWVWELQKLLINQGYAIPKDGIFSLKTECILIC